jgi:hypothetical protein
MFTLWYAQQKLSARRHVCLVIDVENAPTDEEEPFATRDNHGPEMRDFPFDNFRAVEAYCLDDPNSEEGMPDMDPPKKPCSSFVDGDDDLAWGPSSPEESEKSPNPVPQKKNKDFLSSVS